MSMHCDGRLDLAYWPFFGHVWSNLHLQSYHGSFSSIAANFLILAVYLVEIYHKLMPIHSRSLDYEGSTWNCIGTLSYLTQQYMKKAKKSKILKVNFISVDF